MGAFGLACYIKQKLFAAPNPAFTHNHYRAHQVYTAFGTYPRLSLLYFLPSLASGAFLVIWGETRKATLRNLYAREQVWGEVEESWFYKCFAW